ncbi:MAG: hypothetical protein ACOX1L_05695 [Erysipelotrichaceae bacterium]|jgi:uncharacterized membrane protein YhdT
MKNKKNLLTALLSLIILFAGYLLVRYPLFETHGMKGWPRFLLVICVFIIAISYISKAKILPLATSISYMVGFFTGLLFHTTVVDDIVGSTDNLWIIWTVVILVTVIISGIADFLSARKKN